MAGIKVKPITHLNHRSVPHKFTSPGNYLKYARRERKKEKKSKEAKGFDKRSGSFQHTRTFAGFRQIKPRGKPVKTGWQNARRKEATFPLAVPARPFQFEQFRDVGKWDTDLHKARRRNITRALTKYRTDCAGPLVSEQQLSNIKKRNRLLPMLQFSALSNH